VPHQFQQAQRIGAKGEGNLEQFFVASEVAERPDIGDEKCHAELIFGAHVAQRYATVFERKTAAAAVVIDLHDLVLECAVGDVVAEAGDSIKAFAIQRAVTEQGPDLVRKRLKSGVGLQTEVGDAHEEFAIRFDVD